MSVINEVLLSVVDMAQEADVFSPITVGPMPADNSISIAIASGGPDATFIDKGMAYTLDLVMNGKHQSQQIVSDALHDIHQMLTQTKTYPETTTWQITNIETLTTPTYIGREENKQYLYGSSLLVRFYYKKG